MWQPGKPTACTRCGKCCEEAPCGLAPVYRGKCTVYGKRKGIATCYLAKESAAIREALEIGKGCHFYLLNWFPMDGDTEIEEAQPCPVNA